MSLGCAFVSTSAHSETRMKWLLSFFALLFVQVTIASPSLEKRASVSDAANIGYATLNGGTTGGAGGTTTTVTTLDALNSAVAGNAKKIVIISGTITGAGRVKVGSNTSVIGKKGSSLVGVGFQVDTQSNVIIRNVKVSKVLAENGDAIGIQYSSRVWIDHVDVSSDMDHDKDYYDGLIDVTHGCTEITVSNSKLSNHYKTSLVGASDTNTEDINATITYANNYWTNCGSRGPSLRYGHGHIYNNYYENMDSAINTRVGAQVLAENNVFSGTRVPVMTTSQGYAVLKGNDFGGVTVSGIPVGTFTTAPYSYTLLATSSVKASVVANAGQTLAF